jgi:large subunit ribosomal protein L29
MIMQKLQELKTQLKNKSDVELKDELLALRREQFNLRMQRGAQEAPHTHNFKRVRRTIARVKTILNSRVKESVKS